MIRQLAKPVIGLDFDGVISDNSRVKLEMAKKLGWRLTIEETAAEIIKTKLPPEILKKLQQMIYYDAAVALKSSLIPGVKWGLKKLKHQRVGYYLISQRKKPEIAIEFLEKNNLWPIYFNMENSFFVAESEDKEKKSKELGISIFLDDQLSVLTKLISVQNRFLFDYFNVYQNLIIEPGIRIVKSWKDFLNILNFD